jgi:hypothetical protein
LRPDEVSHLSISAERSDSSAFCSSRQRIGLSGNGSALRRAMRAIASRRSCNDTGGRVRSRTAATEASKKVSDRTRSAGDCMFQLFAVSGSIHTVKRGAETAGLSPCKRSTLHKVPCSASSAMRCRTSALHRSCSARANCDSATRAADLSRYSYASSDRGKMRDRLRGSNQTGELSRSATKINSAIIRGFNGADPAS